MHSTSGGSSPPKLAVQCSKALVVFWAAQCPSLLVLLINLWDFRTWTFHACLLSSARKFLISQALRSTQWSIIIHSDSFCCIASNLRGGSKNWGCNCTPCSNVEPPQRSTSTGYLVSILNSQYERPIMWPSKEKVVQCCSESTEMQLSRWTGSKSDTYIATTWTVCSLRMRTLDWINVRKTATWNTQSTDCKLGPDAALCNHS